MPAPRPLPALSRRAFLTALGLVGVAACSDDAGAPVSAAGTPSVGGTVTVLVLSAVRALDPFGANCEAVADGNRMAALYDGLFWINPGTGSVDPQIAESFTPEPDQKTWTLRLRPGVRFSDGTAFDAEAVAANWRMHADPEVGSLQRTALLGMSWKVAGPLVLTVKLDTRNANLDRLVAERLNYVASPAALGDRAAFARQPVGAGPYVLAERAPGREVFTRNPTYWQQDRPYADRLVFLTSADAMGAVKALDKGEADVTVSTVPEAFAEANGRGLLVTRIHLSGGQMIVFNTAREPFDDARLRGAVVRALDARALNREVYAGAGSPARGVFGGASPLTNINLSSPGHDPQLAAQEFAALAADASGGRLSISLLVPDVTATIAVGEYVRSALTAYPQVDFSLEVLSIPEIANRVYGTRDFEMSLSQMWLVDPEPQIYDFLHTGGLDNTSGYSDKAVDAALDQARASSHPSVRRDAYTQVQIAMNRDLPVWAFQESVTAIVSAPDITGVAPANDGILRFDRLGRR